MLLSMVTVTCPGTFVGAERVDGGAGAMGRLGMVGFKGGCKKHQGRSIGNSKQQLGIRKNISVSDSPERKPALPEDKHSQVFEK